MRTSTGDGLWSDRRKIERTLILIKASNDCLLRRSFTPAIQDLLCPIDIQAASGDWTSVVEKKLLGFT